MANVPDPVPDSVPGCIAGTRRRVEGLAAIRAALAEGEPLQLLLVREGAREAELAALVARAERAGVPIRSESPREMRRMATQPAGLELLALFGPPAPVDLETLMAAPGLVCVLVALRYPGNVGFILRAAEVAGAAGVVVANDWRGEPWSEALRLGMRADRFLPVLRADAASAVRAARAAGRRLIALETEGRARPWEVDLTGPVTLLVGGETSGLPAALIAEADAVVRIPTHGFVPSYNVQAAVGVMLGECLRQGEALTHSAAGGIGSGPAGAVSRPAR